MNNRWWNIFNRNMKTVIHKTEGESRSRDVREVVYFLRERNLWWEGGRLLNIGIGDCEEAILFDKEGLEVLGLSHSQPEVDNAKQQGISAVCEDFHQTTLSSELFDYVYGHDVVEHFISPIMVFSQFRRLIKMGGILMFHYPTYLESNWTHWFLESPTLMFDWIMKFGFKLLHFRYNPGESSEFLYIAQKVEISEELYNKGGNTVLDMVREMEQILGEKRWKS